MKKYLSAALSLILAILLVLSLSSCDKKTDKASKAHVHRWGEWSTVKTSTCSEEGEAVRTCKCGDKQTHPIAMLAHTVDSKVVTEPTCLAGGYTTYTCQCGYSYKAGETPLGNHSAAEWTTVKQATCTEAGERTGTCTVCSKAVTETVSALEHQYTYEIIEPTATEQGYAKYTCGVCGDTYNDHFIDPIGQPDQQ